jgi:hypothetical protein
MLSNRPAGIRRTFGADRTNQHQAAASENHHVAVQKTPGATAKTPSRRRALGDISNRKAFGGNAATAPKQRGVTFTTSATKSVSKSVLPSRSSTPFIKNKGVVLTATTATTTTPRATVLAAPPIHDVEFRAGRPFDPFDDEGYELDISIDLLSMESAMPASRGASRGEVPGKHTPQFWMSAFDTKYNDSVDDCSLMMAPDDIESLDSCIDISLEEEVDFLGLAIADISF